MRVGFGRGKVVESVKEEGEGLSVEIELLRSGED